jgi:hypothetical protein
MLFKINPKSQIPNPKQNSKLKTQNSKLYNPDPLPLPESR